MKKALKEAFERLRVGDGTSGMKKATVLTPDLPLHPADAISLIRDICDKEKPDVLVGNSCGSFYAQMISPIIGVPALLGNPHFKMSDFLRERIGSHQYKCSTVVRYFQHFKGNKYRLVHTAFDSETQQRMVVYQALYGDRKYWVRPEKMFFEQVERDGKRFSRFEEIDWEE